MKILIAYYSHTGTIKKIKDKIVDEIGEENEVDVEEIKTNKCHCFYIWCFKNLFRGKCKIKEPEITDVSKYDLIYIGTPNWLGVSLPIKEYIKRLKGMENKNVIQFSSSYFPVFIERILLSVFLLKRNFDNLISEKGGKVIDSIVISGFLYRMGWFEDKVNNQLEGFLSRVQIDISSIKKYYFQKKEIRTSYLFLALTFFLLPILFLIQTIGYFFDINLLSWKEFLPIFIYTFFLFLIMVTTIKIKEALPLIKYIASWTLVSVAGITLAFLNISFCNSILAFPFVLILLVTTFFKSYSTLIFTGLLSIISYLILSFYFYSYDLLVNAIGASFIILVTIVLLYFVSREERKFKSLLKITQNLKEEKDILQVRVKAKTKQLKEQAERLEKENKKKTKKLKEKLNEMRRFQKLTIGRELKMRDLKKKIKDLKNKLNKENNES